MKKIILLLIAIPPLIFAAVFLFVLYEGPRMTVVWQRCEADWYRF